MRNGIRRVACFVLLVLFLLSALSCQREEDAALYVRVLDVGQSDCILLSQGDAHLLIDTGTATSRDAVLAQLTALGIRELAYIIVTHPHEDHYGNARAILETRTVHGLICSSAESKELGYQLLLDAARERDVPVEKVADGYRFSLNDAYCTLVCALPEDENVNNASLVLRVAFGTTVLLFMGDTEAQGEQALMDAHGSGFLDCDLLKVGHHGSDTASTGAFLKLTTPTLAAISCGRENSYGFPHETVLDGLAAVGAEVFRTDTAGTLTFVSNGREVSYEE